MSFTIILPESIQSSHDTHTNQNTYRRKQKRTYAKNRKNIHVDRNADKRTRKRQKTTEAVFLCAFLLCLSLLCSCTRQATEEPEKPGPEAEKLPGVTDTGDADDVPDTDNTFDTDDTPDTDGTYEDPLGYAAAIDEYYRILITERNAVMTEAAKSYLDSGRKVFIVVGTEHLLGNDGVIARLEKEGFAPKQLGGAKGTKTE